MRKIFLALLLLFSLNVKAGIYGDKFTECLLNNTSDRDKIILVKWMFIGMGQHPILKREFPISERRKESADMAVADYISYIITSSCVEETMNVMTNEGEEAFVKSFELLGELAMMLVIENEDVLNSFEDYIKYLPDILPESFGAENL